VAARGLCRDSGNERLEFGEHLSKPRAATEGRPYSTFRDPKLSVTILNPDGVIIIEHFCKKPARLI